MGGPGGPTNNEDGGARGGLNQKNRGGMGGLIYNLIRIVSLSYLGISEPFSHQHIFIWININRMKRQTDRQKTCIIEDIKMTSRRSRNVLEGLTSSLVRNGWAPKGHLPYQIGLNWPKNFTPSLIVITKNGEFRIKVIGGVQGFFGQIFSFSKCDRP